MNPIVEIALAKEVGPISVGLAIKMAQITTAISGVDLKDKKALLSLLNRSGETLIETAAEATGLNKVLVSNLPLEDFLALFLGLLPKITDVFVNQVTTKVAPLMEQVAEQVSSMKPTV